MRFRGIVTDDRMSDRFVEVALLENGEKGAERYIAESPKEYKARHGDVVELEPIEARDIRRDARTAYILPVLGALAGFMITKGRVTDERLLTALLLGLMFFVVAWLLNRRSRLLLRQEYRVVRIVKRRLEWMEEKG